MRFRTLLLLCASTCLAQPPDLGGAWVLKITRYGESDLRRVKFEQKDGRYSARIFGLSFAGTASGGRIELACTNEEEGEKKPCGSLTGVVAGAEMNGDGKIFDDSFTWSATRAAARPAGGPRRHEFVPMVFHHHFAGNIAPALHVYPGDTVHVTTVDAGGADEKGVKRTQGGNPLSGPFYVEGAFPGDTLVVRLNRVRLNRDTAGMFSDSIAAGALDPYFGRDDKRIKDFDSMWKLDRERGTASLSKPTDKLKNFTIKLQPMLGCIAVAPPGGQSFRSGYLGRFGGNMDYNQLREGVTLYFPVFQQGALLFVGDGHAAQGDGELTGNALETSMDVEFTVDLVEGKSLGQTRAESDEYVMVMGIAGSLDDALRSATTGMARWLQEEYKLNSAETAMVLGSSMRYDIAEVVDPQVHIVAKVAKTALAQISR
ncbi:MAG: acetamidase/formamidase family protein [Acidobacteriota bacterium]|nr:acetamidase/formamidase family protein [Acidobacteriota bacterium]